MPQKHTALTKQNLQIYPTERLTDAFAAAWGLEFDDDNHDENEGK